MSNVHTTFIAPECEHLAPLFPGYDIQSLIATGGMGAVYLAVQKSLDRTVAIKILPQELTQDASFCAGFESEAKAMARLNHPNLIGVFDFGEIEGMLYIIMEYVPGKSLFFSANGIAIDSHEVIRLVIGICKGLAHAHENGIIHRDIKPSNILLDLNTQPKIGDFGLARPVEFKHELGQEIFGTPHYTAPEVVNSPRSVDLRADIFSVGVMLHELLTGRLPAHDARPASAIIHCDLRFDTIIRRATNPNPELRYASAMDIAKDLQAIMLPSPTTRMVRLPPSPQLRPTPQARFRRPMVSAKKISKSSSGISVLVWVLLVGVLGIGLFFLLSDEKKRPKIITIERIPVIEKSPPSGPAPQPPVSKPKPNP